MGASEMPAGTIVAASNWVAIKMEFPRLPNFPWEVAGSGVNNATNENIDQLIERGHASVSRVGDGTEPPETVEPEPGILATLNGNDGMRLANDSTITIDGVTYPIPERADLGSVLAPERIRKAILDAGYRPIPAYSGSWPKTGTIRVEKLGE